MLSGLREAARVLEMSAAEEQEEQDRPVGLEKVRWGWKQGQKEEDDKEDIVMLDSRAVCG